MRNYRDRGIFLFILLWIIGLAALQAQSPPSLSASEIKLHLKKLNVIGSVLYIAAHPDDENTRLIAYLTHEKLYRTGYLSLTRGDGGQNLIGNEQAEHLGVIRTQELLAARRIDGGEQYFTRAYDFGYSKTPEETFLIWNKDSVLADVVWIIRLFRPDVIICRFPTTGEGGHGHHTASAILAEEAFVAAADTHRFAEQLKYVQPWQAKRLLWNTYRFGERNTTSEDQFKIDVGGYNALLGKSYGEIAAESRSKHGSQAFGTARQRSTQWEYFKTILGETPRTDLLDGIVTNWRRFPNGEKIEKQIQSIIRSFDHENPSTSVPALVALYDMLQTINLPDENWKKIKLQEIQFLIAACSGLWMEATAKQTYVSLGDSVEINLSIINRSSVIMQLNKIELNEVVFPLNKPLSKNELISESINIKTDETKNAITQPYWLKEPPRSGLFSVKNLLLIGKPENDPALTAIFFITIAGKEFRFPVAVRHKKVDPARGEMYQPFIISPPVTATIEHEVYIFSPLMNKKEVNVKLRTFQQRVEGILTLQVPPGFQSDPASITFRLNDPDTEQLFRFTLNGQDAAPGLASMKAVLTIGEKQISYSHLNIQYEHIPQQTLFPDATARLVKMDLKKNYHLIGYITGAGDKVADALTQIGYDVKEISEEDILNNCLQQYDAIITGVRAYNTEARLKTWQPYLMSYVKEGGTLLIQYNTNQKLVTDHLGPYPFKISRDRVTQEDSPVKLLLPQHSALNFPHRISEEDFNGWIQERGLYFPTDIDMRYEKLLAMHDIGEQPLETAVILCNYGKGRYVYTGLSFFRQLPAGVPGAYKLLVNLLEKP